MYDIETLNHTTWDCEYHIWIPKYRKKLLYGQLPMQLEANHPSIAPFQPWVIGLGIEFGQKTTLRSFRIS